MLAHSNVVSPYYRGLDALGTAGGTPALQKAPPSIFSWLASSLRNPGQHGIHSVSCVGQFHFDWDHRQRRQRGQISAQVDCVFFCRHEAVSLAALSQVQQITDVLIGVGVVIAVNGFRDRLDAGGPQLHYEILWPRDAAEHDAPDRNVDGNDPATYSPGKLLVQWKRLPRRAVGKYNGIGAVKRC